MAPPALQDGFWLDVKPLKGYLGCTPPQMPRLGGHREEAPLLARSCVRDAGYQRAGQLCL
jgi:hypothetical protein